MIEGGRRRTEGRPPFPRLMINGRRPMFDNHRMHSPFPLPMSYRTLRQCIDDLAAAGRLVRIEAAVDPRLEMAEIQRRASRAAGPALYFANVKSCRFPMVSNLF